MSLFGPPNIKKLKKNMKVRKLVTIATSTQGNIKIEAIKALVDIGVPAIDHLLSIEENLGEKGTIAVAILTAIGEKAVLPLISALEGNDSSPNDGLFLAVSALGQIGDSRANKAVLNAINSDDYFLSGRAMYATAILAGHEAQEPILKSIKKNRGSTHGQMTEASAITILGEIGDQKSCPEIIKAIEYEGSYMDRSDIIAKSATALGEICERSKDAQLNSKVSKVLSDLVDDNMDQMDPNALLIGASAALALGNIIDNDAAKILIKALKSKNQIMRSSAAFGLRCSIDEKKIKPLIFALEDDSPDVRKNAAEALGVSNNKSAVTALINSSNDPDESVREKTIQALGFFKEDSVIDLLISSLNDESTNIRTTASLSLGTIGGNRAHSALISAFEKEQDELVKESINISLELSSDSINGK